MSHESRSQAPELLEDLCARFAAFAEREFKAAPEQAAEAGLKFAREMAGNWGGQLVYFPQGLFYEIAERDRQMYAAFTGNNHADLVREFGCSLGHVYRVIKAMRAEDIAKRQGGLFGAADD